MQILHITPRYFPAKGGGEKHIQVISEQLVQLGHEVTILTTDAFDGQVIWNPHKARVHEMEGLLNGVKIRRFRTRHFFNSKFSFPVLHRLLLICSRLKFVPMAVLHQLARFIPWVPDMQKWLNNTEEHFDIIGVFSLPYDSLMLSGQAFAKKRKIPFVAYALAHYGSVNDSGEPDPHSYYYTMRHQTAYIKRSDMLIANSRDEMDFYLDKGMAPEKIVVGGPGVFSDEADRGDGARFRKKHNIDTPIVICIATLARPKGVMEVVEAACELNAEGHGLTLVLIGNSTDEFEAYRKTSSFDQCEGICLLGGVEDDEKYDALAAADVFAMPSKTDSFGMVYLEAWLYDLPVIGAESWGVRCVINDGEDGFLVPYGDVAALKERIKQFVADPDLAVRMGKSGNETTLNEHLWQHKVGIVQSAYEMLVDQSIESGR